MCKNLFIANASKITVEQLTLLKTLLANEMTKVDNDGFGMYAHGASPYLEKACSTTQLAVMRGRIPPEMNKLPLEIEKPLTIGELSGAYGPILFHARMATNAVNIDNTHPFVGDRYVLVHNGIVSYDKEKELNLTTTCDSEILLRLFEQGGIKAMANVSGYYATGIIDTVTGNLLVHRSCDRPNLHFYWCKEIESFVIGTDIKTFYNSFSDMGWTLSSGIIVPPNREFIFKPDGTCVLGEAFDKPKSSFTSTYRNTYNYNVHEDRFPSMHDKSYRRSAK